MSNDKEVQPNSVTYKRKDYLNALVETENALVGLVEKRQAQIEEWTADIEARTADFRRMMRDKFYVDARDKYWHYTVSLKQPVQLAWVYRLLGRPLPTRVDEYGSAEAYADANLSFEDYLKEGFWGELGSSGKAEDTLYAIQGLSAFGWNYTKNPWKDTLEEVQKAIRDVEHSVYDATFTIPRETFDKYAGALVAFELGDVLEPMPEATLRGSLR